MPKDRRYTRKELESLRRADLQSLYKMHGLKGANQTTKAIVDTLVGHFESPAYMSPSRRNAVGAKTGMRKVMVENTKSKGAREMKKRMPAGLPIKAARPAREAAATVESVDLVDLASPVIAEVRTEDVVIGNEAGPSRQNTPTSMLPPAVPLSRGGSGDVSHAAVHQLLKQRDQAWEAKLRAVEQACETRIHDLERRLEERLRSFSGLGMSTSLSAESTPHPQLTITADTPTNTLLGKRTERDISQTPGAGPSRPSSSPASKRARIEHTEEEDSDAHLPHTPSPPPADPHTPSPGHQGVRTDNSRTPGVGGPDFFPPHFSASKGMIVDEGEIADLPYPLFATTPRPSAPLSPTLDVPASAGRNRLAYRAATLTPGRRKPSPAPRAVSEAHRAMTTITESSEPPLSVQLASRRRVASENTPTRLFPQALRAGSVPVSPPQLSPSPSIGASDREGGFTYTPFPPVPRSALSKAAGPQPENQQPAPQPQALIDEDDITDIEEDDSAELDADADLDFGVDSPSRNLARSPAVGRAAGGAGDARDESPLSPARNYMDVAMFGLMGPSDSPGTTQTPGHRTMLGTERYRDTRFGDVPMVQWGSPSVDLGTGTPASFPRRW